MTDIPFTEDELREGVQEYKSTTRRRSARTLDADSFWDEEEKMLSEFPEIFQQEGCIPEREYLKCLTKWKWPGLWANHAHKNTRAEVRRVTSEAFQLTAGEPRPAPEDIRRQLNHLDDELVGISAATGTVLLTFWRPDVYTVMDERAVATLASAGLWRGGSEANINEYPPYLEKCRSIAMETGLSLRDTDRALWYLAE